MRKIFANENFTESKNSRKKIFTRTCTAYTSKCTISVQKYECNHTVLQLGQFKKNFTHLLDFQEIYKNINFQKSL